MFRFAQYLGGRTNLHQIATVHDRDPISNIGHHPHIMGDEHAANLALFAQGFDQFKDLILNRHIQCGSRLIGNDELRIP